MTAIHFKRPALAAWRWLAGNDAAPPGGSANRQAAEDTAWPGRGGSATLEAPGADLADDLVEQMFAQGRHALLVRPQLVGNLNRQQLDRARQEMSRAMSLVPAGAVEVAANDPLQQDQPASEEAGNDPPRRRVHVDASYLDRYAVTNRQFHAFVGGGGYEQLSIWEPEVWPAVLDFVDRTGHPGPRYWHHGRYEPELADHPVVGVSWYEAAAYARWVGKRLAADAEWLKAACWPVALQGADCLQRLYPWGDWMDHTRANLWATGLRRTAPVDAFAEGASLGGVYQLAGNVWEWTAGELEVSVGAAAEASRGAGRLKSLRGGAFNTYFDVQAMCQFQSGDHPLARKHNVGFRCALSACDLAPGLLSGAADLAESNAEFTPSESAA